MWMQFFCEKHGEPQGTGNDAVDGIKDPVNSEHPFVPGLREIHR